MKEESEKDTGEGPDLLWDCFVNWAETLQRVEERKRRP